MLRCNEVTRLCASEEIRRAPLRTRLAFRVHLMMCRFCRRYVKELSAIADATRKLVGAAPDDPARAEAIVRRVLGSKP